jgi:hypothetical protein
LPLSFLQGFGNPRSRVNFNYVSAYVQDDFRVRPNLLIKAGIRYDRESIEFAPKNDGNFSPRIALFYRPRNSDKLSLSASYGIFHGATPYAGALVTDFLDGQKVVTPVLPFPFSLLPFSLPGRRFPSSSSLPAGLQFVPQLARDTVISPSFRNGYAQEANFSVNYLFSPFYGVSASYQYVRGVKIFLARNINPVVRPIPNDPITSQIVGRVNPTRGELISFETSGDSYHSAATFSFFARTPKRLSVLAHLTLAKTIDNYIDSLRVDILEFQNPLDLKSERALSLQDIRGRFVISTTYNLAGARNPFIRNFEISNIITLNSGQPFNLLAGADIDGNGDLASPGDRPGNIGRNAGRNQGFASVDLRVARTLNINERFQLTGYVEAFNLFNRLNVSDVNRVFPIQPDGTFALPQQEDGRFVVTPDRFTGAFRPRQVQIGMRFTF